MFVSLAFVYYSYNPTDSESNQQIEKFQNDFSGQAKKSIHIVTDKSRYNSGEQIKIIVKNEGEKIYYYPGGDRFWGLEYYINGAWQKFGRGDRPGFQLTEALPGDECYIAMYELVLPASLATGANISDNWEQIICPYPDKFSLPSQAEFIGPGSYRLVFNYSFELDQSGNRMNNIETVYSQAFVAE